MLQRVPIILCVLLLISIGCSRSTKIANAEEEVKDVVRPGTSLVECKALEKGLYIQVKRDPNKLCAESVWVYQDQYCEEDETRKEVKPSTSSITPAEAFSGSGNQYCPEAFAKYVNSPACFQYTTGGRTYYIGTG